jgi:hypothetical protein
MSDTQTTRMIHYKSGPGTSRPYRAVFRDGEDADDQREQAWAVAGMLARREYGRRGYARTVRLDSRSGEVGHYEAFIGTGNGTGSTVGRNIWFYVWAQDT